MTTQKVALSSSATSGATTSSGSAAPTTLSGLLTSMLGETREREIINNIQGTPPNSVLEFYIRGKLTEPELNELTPYLISGTNTGTYKKGLINVNTASATVLECVPGISQQIATQIVSTRQSQSQTTPYSDLAWLVSIFGDNAQGHTAAYQAGPYLTTESFQVTADVAAVGPGGLGYRRTLFVIDGSNGAPQIVYRRDMTPLGWALGPGALQSIGNMQTTP